jgi:hypothetical protein
MTRLTPGLNAKNKAVAYSRLKNGWFMSIIAFYNLKGGVGKTASAVNLAYLYSQSGQRTLLWDLDPQGASSWYLDYDTEKKFNRKKLIVFCFMNLFLLLFFP